ncbi:MAG: hypothetical protein RL670_1302 [Actinomycetota bacterium]
MKVGYVVLYVQDSKRSAAFWLQNFGMALKESTPVGDTAVIRVGFGDQDFSFELVPLDLMKENPDGLDLATPSICFYSENLEGDRERLAANGVQVTDVAQRGSRQSFAFCDNEGRWFAFSEAS